jgi:capsular exopolysaccharide synthesis family protein
LEFFLGVKLLEKIPTTELRLPRLNDLKHLMRENRSLLEAFSALHAGIRLNAKFQFGKSILVTSTQPGEGKTMVASCLAITASLAGQTALLVDGDLRRPWIASAIGFEGVGFSDILEGQAEPSETIHAVDLFEDTPEGGALSVMTAGRKPPAIHPAVDWSKARAAFRSISTEFGMVFLDSPPVLAATDALLFAGIVDAVLLVVGTGSADRDEVRQVKKQLELTGTPVIGAALNRFDSKLHGRSSQPYGGYYHDHRR